VTPANPIERFKASLARAEASGLTLPNALSLATVGKDGRPSVRMMLLKGVDERGFVFFTNLNSRKVRELATCSYASLCFWWPSLEEQVRVEGSVEKVKDKEADTYFASRPRGSQLAAWASRQSEALSSREELLAEVEKIGRQFEAKPIPRPPFWSGFLLIPDRIEFWLGRPDRLHERTLYERRGREWIPKLLFP